jgi:hypothetical protein
MDDKAPADIFHKVKLAGFANIASQIAALGRWPLEPNSLMVVKRNMSECHQQTEHWNVRLLDLMTGFLSWCAIYSQQDITGQMRAISFLERPLLTPSNTLNGFHQSKGGFITQSLEDVVLVCLGCGPVGLCALLTAQAKGVKTIYVVDSVDDRLAEAESMGGIPLKLGRDDIKKVIMDVTDGRGADGCWK